MPSARPSAFAGGGGILRDQDGTILEIQFSTKNPLYGSAPPPAGKKSDFKSLWGILTILTDGAQTPTQQPLWVGDATQFGITDDGRGLTGDAPLSKSSDWYIFLNSLVEAGFDESQFPDDDPNVADYTAIRGARAKFGWQKNEKKTSKLGQKVSKKDPKKKFDREDLIVKNYYGQVDVDDIPTQPANPTQQTSSASRPGAAAAPAAKSAAKPKATKATAPAAVDVPTYAAEQVTLAVVAAKDQTISVPKLSVKLLTQLQTIDPQLRADVRAWANEPANLKKIEGLVFDDKTNTVSVEKD